MTNFQRSAVFVALVATGYAGCGRSDIDEGFPTEPVTTGAGGTVAGSGGSSGSGGFFGTGGQFGSGGRVGTGTGGNVGGTGGRAPTGSAGASGSGGRTGTGGSVGTGGRIGTGGTIGTGGNTGSGGGPGGITCGTMTCDPGNQTCCVQNVNGNRTESCLPVGTQCPGGSIGCTGGDCDNGRICCFSIVGLSTSCAAPAQCTDGLSTVLCRNNNDCPTDRRFCCPAIGINICRAYRCPGN